MRNRIESVNSQRTEPIQKASETVYDDAIESAVGSIAAHFLRENKAKKRPLLIPSMGIQINPDGTEEKIDKSE